MASTRNKNQQAEHDMQFSRFINPGIWNTYEHSAGGCAYRTLLPANGLLPAGRIGSEHLAYNGTDIESFLRGTGTVNLVQPRGKFVAELKDVPSLHLVDNRLPVFLPDPLVVQPNQRYARN